jgi:hypothetical protein
MRAGAVTLAKFKRHQRAAARTRTLSVEANLSLLISGCKDMSYSQMALSVIFAGQVIGLGYEQRRL